MRNREKRKCSNATPPTVRAGQRVPPPLKRCPPRCPLSDHRRKATTANYFRCNPQSLKIITDFSKPSRVGKIFFADHTTSYSYFQIHSPQLLRQKNFFLNRQRFPLDCLEKPVVFIFGFGGYTENNFYGGSLKIGCPAVILSSLCPYDYISNIILLLKIVIILYYDSNYILLL